jgi:hypothetical protein
MLRYEEQLVFEEFMRCLPNFAGRAIKWQAGNNPPDILCVDSAGKRIGVELGEWLNKDQMQSSKKRERAEAPFLGVLRSEGVAPPKNIAEVWLTPTSVTRLRQQDTRTFPREIYKLVAEIDEAWPRDRIEICSQGLHLGSFPSGAAVESSWMNRHSLQGYFHKDFSSYPCLERYLNLACFIPSCGAPNCGLRLPWIFFKLSGGAYTPNDAVDALFRLLEKKTPKYVDLHIKEHLDELYLIAYYNKGLRYNTPFIAPGFGFGEIAAIAAGKMAKEPGPFQRVYLFNAIKQNLEVKQIWPLG